MLDDVKGARVVTAEAVRWRKVATTKGCGFPGF